MAIYSRTDSENEQSPVNGTLDTLRSDGVADAVLVLSIRGVIIDYGIRAALACVFAGIAVWQWRKQQ
jgi:hypothetical protein